MFGDVCYQHSSDSNKGYKLDVFSDFFKSSENNSKCGMVALRSRIRLNLLNLASSRTDDRHIFCQGSNYATTTLSCCCYCPPLDIPSKKKRLFAGNWLEGGGRGEDYFDRLPDELVCEVFKFLPRSEDRALCASVSKRWLLLQSHMFELGAQSNLASNPSKGGDNGGIGFTAGDLSRCLAGKKATDLRLAAIAVGAGARGGLGNLSIRGFCKGVGVGGLGVSNLGLSAIGRSCSALQSLSLWNCPLIGDEGLAAIGKGCRLLKKADFLNCASISDDGICALATNCTLLSHFSFERCPRVGNPSLKSIAQHCLLLLFLSICSCPRIDNEGFVAIASNLSSLKQLKLGGMRISDSSLAAMKGLFLLSLDNVTLIGVDGFCSLRNLHNLRRLSISNCSGLNNAGMEMMGNMNGLKHLSLSSCPNVSDDGFCSFLNASSSIEAFYIDSCKISNRGLITALTKPLGKLETLHLVKCDGVMDDSLSLAGYSIDTASRAQIKSLHITLCQNVGDRCLAMVGVLCGNITDLSLQGVAKLTGLGVLALLECGNNHLVDVNLSGCVKVTDSAICSIARRCRDSISSLVLSGCKAVSDESLLAIANHCTALQDLDVANCNISEKGLVYTLSTIGKGLCSLNLSGCTSVTDQILPLIESNCESLSALNLKHCQGLSQNALDHFEADFWQCKVLRP